MPSPSCKRQIILSVQLALAVEHLVHAIAAADEGDEVARLKPISVHVILDRFHRVRKVERIMFPLARLDQRDQHVESIAFGGVALRAS